MRLPMTTYFSRQQGEQPAQSVMPFSVTPPSYPLMIPNQQVTWTLKEKIVLGLILTAAVGGSAYLIQREVRKGRSNKEENNSFEDGASATFAKQIKMAFENDGWPGTDTTALRSVLRQIPSREEFDKAVISYENLYSTPTKKANMLRDMSDELQTTEYNEMSQIINGKPLKKGGALPGSAHQNWAKRLKAAFDKTYGPFAGTDGEAVIAVFTEIPTQNDFVKVAVEFQRAYITPLKDALLSEGEFGQFEEWMKIILRKRAK